LRNFLGFSQLELERLLVGLSNASGLLQASGEAATPAPAMPMVEGPPRRFPCLAPRDCVSEAFARFYQQLWRYGMLPLRHPWLTDPQDHIFGLLVKLRRDNDGWGPKGHEHTLERVQLAHWLQLSSDHILPEDMPGERRCLEWDSTEYSRHYFKKQCSMMDVIAYDGGENRAITHPSGARRYVLDIHTADDTIPENSTGIVISCQVFEHLQRPHIAMAQLFRLLAPGGFVVWSAPMFSELHGSPEDYFRYTPHGAVSMATDAGFLVVGTYAPGGLRETVGYMLGVTAPYWDKEDILEDKHTNWPLQVYLLLQKPP